MKRIILLACLAVLACAKDNSGPIVHGTGPDTSRPSLDTNYRPSGHASAGDVSVHLFDWPWTDIAKECEQVLAPNGYKAVQISPPSEHSITPSHDWSERYQTVSYKLDRSRSGTGTEFADMVNRCKAVGIDIYADVVINHMTNSPSPGIGSAGTAYSKYNYPGLYTEADFHSPCTVTDYNNAANVQECELFGLPDLNTGLASVRQKIAGYLISLARLGVAGYRVDAAKHIQQVELDKIFQIVDSTMTAEGKPVPYYYLEVAGNGNGEAIGPRMYFGEAYSSGGAADITEFTFVGVGDKFKQVGGQKISDLKPSNFPGTWGMLPSDKAVVFLQNHDTQHQGGLSYKDGQVFRLANVFMLAQPFGYPSVLSSFAFTDNSMGPPSDAAGWTKPVVCAASFETATVGQFVCEHRDPYIARMVGFRKVTAGTSVTNWWDNGSNAIAFSRENKGFVAINRETTTVTINTTTALPAGTYCDLITGVKTGNACGGKSITVATNGAITFDLPANSAVAIDALTKL